MIARIVKRAIDGKLPARFKNEQNLGLGAGKPSLIQLEGRCPGQCSSWCQEIQTVVLEG